MPLEPWLPASERRAARVPAPSTGCPPQIAQDAAPLVLFGVREGAVIQRAPGESQVSLTLQTSGGEGRRWWFLNGEPQEGSGKNLTLTLQNAAEYQLVVMDEGGQVATLNFSFQSR